jgi:hypothetical protein
MSRNTAAGKPDHEVETVKQTEEQKESRATALLKKIKAIVVKTPRKKPQPIEITSKED